MCFFKLPQDRTDFTGNNFYYKLKNTTFFGYATYSAHCYLPYAIDDK